MKVNLCRNIFYYLLTLTITSCAIATTFNNELIGLHALLVGIRRRAVVVVALGACRERRGVATRGVDALDFIAEGYDVGLHALYGKSKERNVDTGHRLSIYIYNNTLR